jgi:hypothetical protein
LPNCNCFIFSALQIANRGWRFIVKRSPGFVEDAHILQTAHSETHQSRQVVLKLGTDEIQRPRAPETISGVL